MNKFLSVLVAGLLTSTSVLAQSQVQTGQGGLIPGEAIFVPDSTTSGMFGYPKFVPADTTHPVPVTGTVVVDTSTLATSANQTTQITAEQAIQATAGATTGTAVTTDVNGTLQQYLRGLIKLYITAPPTGAALDASITTTNTDLGPPGATACATDNGSCSLNALAQRIAQRITSLITALGSPFQAGGALGAGTAGIGNVGGKTTMICVTPTVTATNSYGTNYVVGGLLTFSNLWTATGTGVLQSVVVTIKKVETSGFTFVPFNSNPSNTTWTDAAVAAINAADVAAVREPITLSAYSGLGTHTVASAVGIGQAMAPASTTQYGVLIANAALTNQFGSTSDVQVCAKVLNDM